MLRKNTSYQKVARSLRGPLTVAASPAAEHRLQTRRLSNCGSRAQLLRGMWDLPRPGLEPVSRALAGRSSITAPPGKPLCNFLSLYEWKSAILSKVRVLRTGYSVYFSLQATVFYKRCRASMTKHRKRTRSMMESDLFFLITRQHCLFPAVLPILGPLSMIHQKGGATPVSPGEWNYKAFLM